VSDPQSSFYETEQFNKIIQFVGAKGRIMGYHLKQTAKDFIFVQDEIRGMKQAKGTLETLVGVVG
jgi:hypothetical protein